MSAIKAVNKLFLFRIENEAGNAWKVAYQTDTSTSESRAYDSNETKDGVIKAAGAYEASHSLTSYLQDGDSYVGKLKDLVRKADKRLEVWSIDRTALLQEEADPEEQTEQGGNDGNGDEELTIPGEYSIDVVTNVSESAGSDGNVEITIDTEVEKGIVSGNVEVSQELRNLLVRIADEFKFAQPIEGEDETPPDPGE